MSENREIRLQKYIADCGVTSRRKAEGLIVQGRVCVNGEIITLLGTKVDPSLDAVTVDGQVVEGSSIGKLYLVMNKPRGYMTTLHDPEGRKTVVDLCREITERIYPVGRLDYLSEGLLIMTNDGEVANQIIHPSSDITKVYEVKVFGVINEAILKKLRKGVSVDGVFLKPQSVRVIKQLPTKTWLEFRLKEGKNREIRKICEACGITIDKLKRFAIGGLTVDGIAPGNYNILTKKQLLDKIHTTSDYFSKKKSVNLKKKGAPKGTSADDETFNKFRRETYFETLKAIKETKAEAAKKIRREEYEAKELARKEREEKRTRRENKKAKVRFHNQKTTHAQFVK